MTNETAKPAAQQIAEILQIKSKTTGDIEAIKLDLLLQLVANTGKIVALLSRSPVEIVTHHDAPKQEPMPTVPAEEPKAGAPVVAKKAPKAKAQPAAPANLYPKEPVKVVTKEDVLSQLISFIENNGEEALAKIFSNLGGKSFSGLSEIPTDLYPELLSKINQA